MPPAKPLVFVSYSRTYTEKVAKIIHTAIELLYPPHTSNIEAFFSKVSVKYGRFDATILKSLRRAKAAIIILSPENALNSPWLMYEAGALSVAVSQNKGELIPYLFCRHREDVETPIYGLHNYQYQKDSADNEGEFTRLMLALNELIPETLRLRPHEVTRRIGELWSEFIKDDFEAIAKEMLIAKSSGHLYSLDNKENKVIPHCVGFKTDEQGVAYLPQELAPKTPRDIENYFSEIASTYITPAWIKQTDEEREKFNACRIMVNETRFSTFVAFTDGKNILLYDRKRDPKNVNVQNDRFDVFGSVQFENRSLAMKINSKSFLDAKIEKIIPMPGAAIEDNRRKISRDCETAVMFGIIAKMSRADLEKALLSTNAHALTIVPADSVLAMEENQITSKAKLSALQIIGTYTDNR